MNCWCDEGWIGATQKPRTEDSNALGTPENGDDNQGCPEWRRFITRF